MKFTWNLLPWLPLLLVRHCCLVPDDACIFKEISVSVCVCAREMFFKFDFFKSMWTFSCTSQLFCCYRPCVLVLVHVRLGVCLHVNICDKRPVCMLVLSVQTYLC